MKCPVCGEQTKGIDHNGRGLRCTACWALLPVEAPPEPAPEVVVVPEKPKAKAPRRATVGRVKEK